MKLSGCDICGSRYQAAKETLIETETQTGAGRCRILEDSDSCQRLEGGTVHRGHHGLQILGLKRDLAEDLWGRRRAGQVAAEERACGAAAR